MTIDQAKSFVQKHGVVLASGKGLVPRLAEAVVSEPITGSWCEKVLFPSTSSPWSR